MQCHNKFETARQCQLLLITDYKGKDEEKGYLQFLFNINRNWNVFVELVLSTTVNRTNKTRKGLLEHYHSNSPFLRVIVKWLLLQGDTANRSTFLSIGNLGIHLCCCHILVTEITLHYGNTGSCVQLETGKAVA